MYDDDDDDDVDSPAVVNGDRINVFQTTITTKLKREERKKKNNARFAFSVYCPRKGFTIFVLKSKKTCGTGRPSALSEEDKNQKKKITIGGVPPASLYAFIPKNAAKK